jgi:hypothetical protein
MHEPYTERTYRIHDHEPLSSHPSDQESSISQAPIHGATLYVLTIERHIDPTIKGRQPFYKRLFVNGLQLFSLQPDQTALGSNKHSIAFWSEIPLKSIEVGLEYVKTYECEIEINGQEHVIASDRNMTFSLHVYPNFSISETPGQLFAFHLFVAMSPYVLADIVLSNRLSEMKFLDWISNVQCNEEKLRHLRDNEEYKKYAHSVIFHSKRDTPFGETHGRGIPMEKRCEFVEMLKKKSNEKMWDICLAPSEEYLRFLPRHVWFRCLHLHRPDETVLIIEHLLKIPRPTPA